MSIWSFSKSLSSQISLDATDGGYAGGGASTRFGGVSTSHTPPSGATTVPVLEHTAQHMTAPAASPESNSLGEPWCRRDGDSASAFTAARWRLPATARAGTLPSPFSQNSRAPRGDPVTKFTPRLNPSSAGGIVGSPSSTSGPDRATSAAESSSATRQGRKTPHRTSSGRTFFPARVRHGRLSAAWCASALPTSPSGTGTSVSGVQNRTCVVPNETSRSGARGSGVNAKPFTAGGVVW